MEIALLIVGLAVGIAGGYFITRYVANSSTKRAHEEAEQVVSEAKRQAETMRFGLFHGIALKASNGHHQTEQNRDHADDAARIKHARDAQRVNHLTAQKRTSADAEVEDAREKRHGNRFLFIGRNIDDLRLVHNAHRSRAYAPQNNNAKYCRKAQTRRRMHQQQGYRHTDGDGPKERETETGIQL